MALKKYIISIEWHVSVLKYKLFDIHEHGLLALLWTDAGTTQVSWIKYYKKDKLQFPPSLAHHFLHGSHTYWNFRYHTPSTFNNWYFHACSPPLIFVFPIIIETSIYFPDGRWVDSLKSIRTENHWYRILISKNI